MKITEIVSGKKWEVHSDSGNTYEVRHIMRMDEMGSLYFVWTCDCPARKRCKHIAAVEEEWEAVDAQSDERDEI